MAGMTTRTPIRSACASWGGWMVPPMTAAIASVSVAAATVWAWSLVPLDVVQLDGVGHIEDGVDVLPAVGAAVFDDDVGQEDVVDLAFGDDAVFLGSYDGCEEGGSGYPSSWQQYASAGEVELVVGDVEDALACSSLGWPSYWSVGFLAWLAGCGGCQMRRWPEGVVGSS